jgi:hypothetical protein
MQILRVRRRFALMNAWIFQQRDVPRDEKVEGFLEYILKIATKPDSRGRAEPELGNDLVPRVEHLA